jgi:hypothetical protein
MQKLLIIASALFWSALMVGSVAAQTAVTTYHYDNLRTGWNPNETVLTATNFPNNFGVLKTVPLDDQVDAQPLIVPGVTIGAGQYAGSQHDVVYVATESNSVYAIDATSGIILMQINLGQPVPQAAFGCNFNGPNLGINGTPVIDLGTQTLYVIAYVYVNGSTPTYQLYALNLTTLAEQGNSPLTISPSNEPITHQSLNEKTHTITITTFDAAHERQRPGLVLFYERIDYQKGRGPFPFGALARLYAGFGSGCDVPPGRGWILGWSGGLFPGQSPVLAQLPGNQVMYSQPATSYVGACSIWMSGYGIASPSYSPDRSAVAIFFAT